MLIRKTAGLLFLALVAGGLTFPQSAQASSSQAVQYDVRYNPVELTAAGSAEVIIHRIHNAANEVCWDELGAKRYIEKLKVQRCLRDVTQDFVAKIGHPNLDIAHINVPAPKKLRTQQKTTQWAKVKRTAP